jgi:hypothetical protein
MAAEGQRPGINSNVRVHQQSHTDFNACSVEWCPIGGYEHVSTIGISDGVVFVVVVIEKWVL